MCDICSIPVSAPWYGMCYPVSAGWCIYKISSSQFSSGGRFFILIGVVHCHMTDAI